MQTALFVSPRTLSHSYGPNHPFQVERVGDVLLLLNSLGYLPRDGSPIDHPPARRADLEIFHDPSYLDCLEAEGGSDRRVALAYGLGTSDNPIFPGLWEACLLVAGGSLTAAAWVLDGLRNGSARRAFHPTGGLHHAHASSASGFCYVNDGVLAIRRMVGSGYRVLYVDVDAHHGDGVQEAFYSDPSVLTISIHQDGRTLYPGTGFPTEIGTGPGMGYSVNFPLLPGATDEDFDFVIAEVLDPLVRAYRPDIIVTEIGVDSLRDDPLTLLDWSLAGLDRFLDWTIGMNLPWLALGGGGYRRWNVIRGWSLVWARMIGTALPERRPLRNGDAPLPEIWPIRLWDEPPPRNICDPAMRGEHRGQILAVLRERVFPRIQGS